MNRNDEIKEKVLIVLFLYFAVYACNLMALEIITSFVRPLFNFDYDFFFFDVVNLLKFICRDCLFFCAICCANFD